MMKSMHDIGIGLPTIVEPAEWQKALANLVVNDRTRA